MGEFSGWLSEMNGDDHSRLFLALSRLSEQVNLPGKNSGAFSGADFLSELWQEVKSRETAVLAGATSRYQAGEQVGQLWVAVRELQSSLSLLATPLERLSLALSNDELINLDLSGVELAALLGAASVAETWTFETEAGSSTISRLSSATRSWVYHRLGRREKEHWSAHGLAPGGAWPDELFAARVASRARLALSLGELRVTAVMLRAASQEFSGNWDEFQMVTGCSFQYGARHPMLCELADRIDVLIEQHD